MDDFRWVLILAGALGIGGLLWHGLWSLRKQQRGSIGKEKPLAELYKEQQERDRDDQGFDGVGVSEVKTLGGESADKSDAQRLEPSFSAISDNEPDPEQVEFQLEQPEAQMSDETPKITAEAEPQPEPETVVSEPEQVLILTVVAAPGDEISGADLLPNMLTLGFKFGDMGIFHRHEDSSGQGAVLFSIANMVKPGTFDVDNMEQFQTPGISLFMTLPNAGDAAQSFNMMLNGAQKLARELKCQVLDESRSVLTNQKIRHYQERIREFERQRLIVS
ncbi:cell division protein ZipA [Echinimonas agarilytica]|uniref:Cell division protein ZipA n=1 Tax=Echinimonas agarilytica TaxID=1215918 RepID=A0AA42B777_9GAMM|nr:cell division protein ZipA [Echinimonas agarilytica]MCM2679316.1 cell division protein ZipA [Echinimonas agarilytica]